MQAHGTWQEEELQGLQPLSRLTVSMRVISLPPQLANVPVEGAEGAEAPVAANGKPGETLAVPSPAGLAHSCCNR
jgi:hypothetical protein